MKAVNRKKGRRRVLLGMELSQSVERRVGIADYAREAGWILDSRLVAFLVRGQHREYLASTQIDGIISLVYNASHELLEVVKSANVPVVDLWHDLPEWKVPRVLLDHRAIGRTGAEHLLNLGLKNLLFYSHTVDSRIATVRRDAFGEYAAGQGVKINELWWEPQTSMPNGVGRIGWLARQLEDLPRPLGVLAVNDIVASEVVDAAEQAGLRVPEDVAILGADNDPILTELGAMPLSSIDVARQRVGYEAASLLDRLMDGEEAPAGPILVAPAGVVTRRSTEVIAVEDADIHKAAHYIQEHFREPITVADVAAHTFLSRRRLQDRFRTAIGHGMSEEITRQRVEFGKHLLTQTKHKISSIATMCGFGSVHRMSKVFRRELGVTPQGYRKTYQLAPRRQS